MKKVIIVMFWTSSISFLIITRAELNKDHEESRDHTTLSKSSEFCNNSGIWKQPHVSRDKATWPEALDICNNDGSIASFDYYVSAPNQAAKSELLWHLNGSSGWLYGLEGIANSTFNFQISSKSCSIPERVLCESIGGGGFNPGTKSAYHGGKKICKNENGTIASLNNTKGTLELLRFRSLFWTTFWVGSVDENSIINDKYQEINVKCLLLDETGQLRSDDCFAKHRVICANEVLKPTVKYVNISTIIKPYVAPTHEPPTTTAGTTGTSARVVTTTNITRRITSNHITSPHVTNITVTTMLTDNGVNSEETQYIIIIGSVSVVLVIVVIGLCCLACRRKAKKSSGEPKLSEVYSDAADSIVIRRASGQVDPGVEYATPDDALTSKKAIPRSSVNSDTYDALNEPLKQKASSKEHVNVYSHVQIVQSDVAAELENTYDITSYSMNKKSMPQTKDQNETYGSVGVKIS